MFRFGNQINMLLCKGLQHKPSATVMNNSHRQFSSLLSGPDILSAVIVVPALVGAVIGSARAVFDTDSHSPSESKVDIAKSGFGGAVVGALTGGICGLFSPLAWWLFLWLELE